MVTPFPKKLDFGFLKVPPLTNTKLSGTCPEQAAAAITKVDRIKIFFIEMSRLPGFENPKDLECRFSDRFTVCKIRKASHSTAFFESFVERRNAGGFEASRR